MTGDGDAEREGLQPGPSAIGARHLAHVPLDLLSLAVALGVGVAALQPGDDALVLGLVGPLAPVAVAVLHLDATARGPGAEQQQLLLLPGQLSEGHVRGDVVGGAHRLEQPTEVLGPCRGPWSEGPLGERQVGVGHDQLGIDLEPRAESIATLAGAVGRVEREVPGGELLERETAHGATEVLAEGEDLVVESGLVVAIDDLHLGHALGDAQRRLEGVGEPPLDAVTTHETVDDDLDGVLLVAGQLDGVGELVQLTVDDGAGETLRGQVGQKRVVGAFPASHDGGQHLEARALGELEDAIDDLLGRLAGDHRTVVGTVRHADAGEQQAQVVVDLGDRPDGGAGIARGALLVDRDGRRQPLDEVDVGLVHLTEELTGVGRQRLDVAPLAFGVDGVERQRRLARAGQAREDDQAVAGEVE